MYLSSFDHLINAAHNKKGNHHHAEGGEVGGTHTGSNEPTADKRRGGDVHRRHHASGGDVVEPGMGGNQTRIAPDSTIGKRRGGDVHHHHRRHRAMGGSGSFKPDANQDPIPVGTVAPSPLLGPGGIQKGGTAMSGAEDKAMRRGGDVMCHKKHHDRHERHEHHHKKR